MVINIVLLNIVVVCGYNFLWSFYCPDNSLYQYIRIDANLDISNNGWYAIGTLINGLLSD